MNLVGGNIHSEILQAKEEVINPLRSDEAYSINVEEKLMGTLLLKS